MSTDYPGALDTTKLTNPNTTDKRNSPSLAGAQANQNDAIKAVETKIGTGASTPVANTILFGTGTGISSWTALTSAQLAATLSDETGTGSAVFATTPTLVTPKVDTINESTPANGTTIGGVNIKSGALNTNNSVVTANITDSNVTSPKVATGFVVQVVSTNTTTFASGTTQIPLDDTIPQNTEGDQYLTQAITPKSATNRLSIEVLAYHSSSGAVIDIIGALFQDATANALSATSITQAGTTYKELLTLRYDMVAGTTSSTTFKYRAGPGSAVTVYFNGSGSRLLGGVAGSNIKITEYKG